MNKIEINNNNSNNKNILNHLLLFKIIYGIGRVPYVEIMRLVEKNVLIFILQLLVLHI